MGDIYASGGTVSYPTSLDTASTQVNQGSRAFSTSSSDASKINNLASAVIALETKVNTVAGSGTNEGILYANSSGNFIQNAGLIWDTATNFLKLGSPGSTTGAAAGDLALKNTGKILASNAAGNNAFGLLTFTSGNALQLGSSSVAMAIGSPASVSGAAGGEPILGVNKILRATNNAATGTNQLLSGNNSDQVFLSPGAADVKYGVALIAMGGGAGATLGTIGGSGPVTATQQSWMRWINSAGAAFWLPTWI